MYRHISLVRASWPRLLELRTGALQLCIWGFTASFFAARLGSPGIVAAGALLGGVLLWKSRCGPRWGWRSASWRKSGSGTWTRVRQPPAPWELVAALVRYFRAFALRSVLTPALLLAWLLYAFNVFGIGWC